MTRRRIKNGINAYVRVRVSVRKAHSLIHSPVVGAEKGSSTGGAGLVVVDAATVVVAVVVAVAMAVEVVISGGRDTIGLELQPKLALGFGSELFPG